MKITLFYSKRTGKIMSYCISDVGQNMDFFGNDKEDFELIYDFVVFDNSSEFVTILNNRDMFYVDIDTKEIKQHTFKF